MGYPHKIENQKTAHHNNRYQEPADTSKQPIRTRYLGHVTGYQPIRDQYFLIRSVPDRYIIIFKTIPISLEAYSPEFYVESGYNIPKRSVSTRYYNYLSLSPLSRLIPEKKGITPKILHSDTIHTENQKTAHHNYRYQKPTDTSKQPIRTRYLELVI
eukprot:sb/3473102/